MEEIYREPQLQEKIRDCRLLIVLYGSAGCGPCQAIREKLSRWQEDHPQAGCLYIPLELAQALAAQNGVYAAPALQIFMDGRPMLREAGCFSLSQILSKVEFYIENFT